MRKDYCYISNCEIPLYRGKLIVIISDQPKAVHNQIGSIDEHENMYAHSISGDYKGSQGFFVVLNPNNSYRNITHGVIAHEATHISHFIAMARGVEPDFINSEPIAYLVEWITDSIYESLKKHKFKID